MVSRFRRKIFLCLHHFLTLFGFRSVPSSHNGPTFAVHCDLPALTSISQPASIVSSVSTSNTGDSNMSSSGSGNNGGGNGGSLNSLSAYPSTGESNLKALLSTPSVSISFSPHPDSMIDADQSKNLSKTSSNISTRTSLRPSSNASGNFTQSFHHSSADSLSVCGETLAVKKNAARTKLLPCKDRKYDPDRHCGVRLNEQDQPCTRSLTCKTHSLTLRRSVVGRSDMFDTLLNQHRLEKEAAMRAAGIEVKPTKQQLKQQQKLQKELALAGSGNSNNRSSIKNRTSFVGGTSAVAGESSPISASSVTLSSSASLTPGRSQLLAQLQSPVVTPITPGTPSLVISPVKQSSRLLSTQHSAVAATTPTLSSSLQQSSFHQSMFISSSSSAAVAANLDIRPSPPPLTTISTSINNSQACLKSSSTPSSSMDTNASLHCSKLLLQKLSGKLTSRAAAAAAAVQQQQNCAADLLFGCETNYCDSTQKQPSVNTDQLYLLSCHPRPAALCTYNARQVRLDHHHVGSVSTSGSSSSVSPSPLLSSRLFNRKQDLAYSALAAFRSATGPSSAGVGHSVPSMSDDGMQFDSSLQSCSNHRSSGGGGGMGGFGGGDQSNSTSLHSNGEKCFVNIFNTSANSANLFSSMWFFPFLNSFCLFTATEFSFVVFIFFVHTFDDCTHKQSFCLLHFLLHFFVVFSHLCF